MKTIGLLGGTSWPSTIDYYSILNKMVNERLGGFHSAKLLLKSVDYHDIKTQYGRDWEAVAQLLKAELEDFISLRPDILLICNNSLHKPFDSIRYTLDLSGIKFIHMVEEVGREAVDLNQNRALLLGTKFTMQDGYYARKLTNDFGLTIEIPSDAHCDQIQAIQSAIAAGADPETHKDAFKTILESYKNFDAVILACTELPLVVKPDVTSLPILNPTYLQCRAAVNYALS